MTQAKKSRFQQENGSKEPDMYVAQYQLDSHLLIPLSLKHSGQNAGYLGNPLSLGVSAMFAWMWHGIIP